MKVLAPVAIALAVVPSAHAAPIPIPSFGSWLSGIKDKVVSAASTAWSAVKEVPQVVESRVLDRYDQYNNLDEANYPNWMASIPDETLISQMSIPGTHDTMTFQVLDTPVAQCQSFNLAKQFKGGIRFIDARARHMGNLFKIYHSVINTHHDIPDVLRSIAFFLQANPTETIIMRHKDEYKSEDCTRPYAETFDWYRYTNPDTKNIYANYAWKPKDPNNPQIPTLGELRGKFLTLMDFENAPADGGLLWDGPHTILEDDWDIGSNADIDRKMNSVTNALEAARNDKQKSKIYLTGLNGASAAIWPRPLALGSNDHTGINPLTMAKLELYAATGDKTPVGVVIMDFPGQQICRDIINLNPSR